MTYLWAKHNCQLHREKFLLYQCFFSAFSPTLVCFSWCLILACSVSRNLFLCFRWTEELANLKSEKERLVGDCLISASFLSYTGAFSWEFRRRMIYDDWEVDLRSRNVPLSKPFRPETTLANDSDFIR